MRKPPCCTNLRPPQACGPSLASSRPGCQETNSRLVQAKLPPLPLPPPILHCAAAAADAGPQGFAFGGASRFSAPASLSRG
jgi:hypothetical protein